MGRLKRRWRKRQAQRELRRKYVDTNLGRLAAWAEWEEK